MSMIRKLQIKFICVFMGLMLVLSAAIGTFVYFDQKAALEYQCMVYLLNIHNYGNKVNPSADPLTFYPSYFVLEIDNVTNTAEVVMGRFFLEDEGVTTDELIDHLTGHMDESGVLKEYQVRYFNGIREEGGHRVSFIDISYIGEALQQLLERIVLVGVSSLLALFLASVLLSRWFSKPAKQTIDERTQFISKLSHELKTPVSIIRANIDLIDGGGKADEADFLFGCDNIRHECERMTNLIEAMTLTALPTQNNVKEWAAVDMTELLQREMLRFEVVAFDQGLSLSLDVEEGLAVTGNEIQLRQLVDIIVENAIKYCTPGGAIEVTASGRAGHGRKVRLCCANTGEEMTREQKDKIFKPFYQVDGTKKGAGLGLAIASEIVSSMRGTIELEYQNGKNCFIIEL